MATSASLGIASITSMLSTPSSSIISSATLSRSRVSSVTSRGITSGTSTSTAPSSLYTPPPTTHHNDNSNRSMIAGIVGGIVALVGCVLFFYLCIKCGGWLGRREAAKWDRQHGEVPAPTRTVRTWRNLNSGGKDSWRIDGSAASEPRALESGFLRPANDRAGEFGGLASEEDVHGRPRRMTVREAAPLHEPAVERRARQRELEGRQSLEGIESEREVLERWLPGWHSGDSDEETAGWSIMDRPRGVTDRTAIRTPLGESVALQTPPEERHPPMYTESRGEDGEGLPRYGDESTTVVAVGEPAQPAPAQPGLPQYEDLNTGRRQST